MTADASAPALEIRDLRVDYGHLVAVDGLSFDLPRGEVLGLVGPNGAGKTSTFRVIATLQEPTYGRVRVAGFDTADAPAGARSALGYMPDLAPVPGDLKVWEFLDCFALAHGIRGGRRQRVNEVLEEVRLTDKRDTFCHQLSRGMKQRVVLAKTLLHTPTLCVLDEPASGMDPASRSALRATLEHLRRSGCAVVVSSHILGELSGMCTLVALMHRGRLVDFGPVHEVTDRAAHSRKRLLVRLAPGSDHAAAAEWFAARELCGTPEVAAGGLVIPFSGAAEEEAGLLREAVLAGIAVRHFSEEGTALERVIMDIHENGGGGDE